MDDINKLILAVALCAALPVGVALAQPPAAPKAPAAPVAPSSSMLPIKDFMRHVVNPAAEAYWAASGIVGDVDRAPKDDAGW
jgi:hypothetical protein